MKKFLFSVLALNIFSAILIAAPLGGFRLGIGPLGLLAVPLGILAAIAMFQRRVADGFCARVDKAASASSMPALALIGTLSALLLFAQAGQYMAFQTNAYDLRLHAELARNIWHGRGFQSDFLGCSYLGRHVSPVFILLSPLAMFPDIPFALLVLQGVATAVGSWITWRLAGRLGIRPCLALVWALLFLLYRGLLPGYFEGFHHEIIAACALMGFLYFLERDRLLPAACSALLALACREEVAVLLAGAAAVMLVRRRHRRFASALLGLSIVWLLICYLWVIPSHAEQGRVPGVERWRSYGESALAIPFGMVKHPLQVAEAVLSINLVKLFGCLLFLPLASPGFWLPTLPLLVIYATSAFPMQAGLVGAYSALFVPWWIAGAMNTMGRPPCRKWLGDGRIAILVGVALLLLNFRELPLPVVTSGLRQAHHRLAQVTREASAGRRVLAQGCVLPHLGWAGTFDMIGRPEMGPPSQYDIICLGQALDPWPLRRWQIDAMDRQLQADPHWLRTADGPLVTYERAREP